MPVEITAVDQKKFEAFFCEVGRALSTWSGVESYLCLIYSTLLGGQSIGPHGRAFWAVHSFEGRLAMTHAAMDAVYNRPNNPFWQEWKAVRGSLDDLNLKRNEVAHGTVVCEAKSIEAKEYDVVFVPFHGEAVANPKKWNFKWATNDAGLLLEYKRRSIDDIKAYTAAFEAATGPVLNVFETVYKDVEKRKLYEAELKKKPTEASVLAPAPAPTTQQ